MSTVAETWQVFQSSTPCALFVSPTSFDWLFSPPLFSWFADFGGRTGGIHGGKARAKNVNASANCPPEHRGVANSPTAGFAGKALDRRRPYGPGDTARSWFSSRSPRCEHLTVETDGEVTIGSDGKTTFRVRFRPPRSSCHDDGAPGNTIDDGDKGAEVCRNKHGEVVADVGSGMCRTRDAGGLTTTPKPATSAELLLEEQRSSVLVPCSIHQTSVMITTSLVLLRISVAEKEAASLLGRAVSTY